MLRIQNESRRIKDKRLGQILIELGYIDQQQLEEALSIQRKNNKGRNKTFSGEIMIKLGYVNEKAVFHAFVSQYRFPFLPLDNYQLDSRVIDSFPAAIAREHMVMPIDKYGNVLTVAISNPFDTKALKQIEKATNCNVQVFVSSPTDLRLAVDRYYSNGNKN